LLTNTVILESNTEHVIPHHFRLMVGGIWLTTLFTTVVTKLFRFISKTNACHNLHKVLW